MHDPRNELDHAKSSIRAAPPKITNSYAVILIIYKLNY